MRDRIEAIGRLLLAAAYADMNFESWELKTIEKLLREVWGSEPGSEPLPADVLPRVLQLDPHGFDLDLAVRPFIGDSKANRRRIVELAVKVHEADGTCDAAEASFLRLLGAALRLKPAEYADLLAGYVAAPTKAARGSRKVAKKSKVTSRTMRPAAKTAKAKTAKAKTAKAKTAKAKTAKAKTKAPRAKATKAKPKAAKR